MNRDQMANIIGLVAGVALIAILVGGWWFQRPVADRTIVLFAGLLWTTLQLDIAPNVPFTIGRRQSDDNGLEEAEE